MIDKSDVSHWLYKCKNRAVEAVNTDIQKYLEKIIDELPDIKNYVSENTEPTQPSESEFLRGDVNLNGSVDIADVVAIASYIGDSRNNPLSDNSIVAGDVQNTGDGLTPGDVLMIQQYLATIIKEL